MSKLFELDASFEESLEPYGLEAVDFAEYLTMILNGWDVAFDKELFYDLFESLLVFAEEATKSDLHNMRLNPVSIQWGLDLACFLIVAANKLKNSMSYIYTYLVETEQDANRLDAILKIIDNIKRESYAVAAQAEIIINNAKTAALSAALKILHIDSDYAALAKIS